MIDKIGFIVNDEEMLERTKEVKERLEKDNLNVTLWDRTTPESRIGAGGGPSIGDIVTVIISIGVVKEITKGGLQELGKDIYKLIKSHSRKLIKRNNTRFPQESLLLTVDLGLAPNYWFDFHFYTDNIDEILQGISQIAKIVVQFEKMRKDVELTRVSFGWHKGVENWSLQ